MNSTVGLDLDRQVECNSIRRKGPEVSKILESFCFRFEDYRLHRSDVPHLNPLPLPSLFRSVRSAAVGFMIDPPCHCTAGVG